MKRERGLLGVILVGQGANGPDESILWALVYKPLGHFYNAQPHKGFVAKYVY